MSLATRLEAIRAGLPAGTRLLAVSKGHPPAAVAALAALGQRSFGESRLQEGAAKQEALSEPAMSAGCTDLDWHFIGRLQTNKARGVLRRFATIHSVDSLRLAERLQRIADEERLRPRIFLQVALRPDPGKGGFGVAELQQAWPRLQQLGSLRIVGLMTILPMGLDAPERRLVFRECRSLSETLGLAECSMGMSGDWREAVAEGSTWVRLGSALFGPRPGATGG